MESSREAFVTCMDCKPLNTPGMRSTTVHAEGQTIRYLHQFWVCAACGREWEDEDLRRRNELAREQVQLFRSQNQTSRVV
jgi:transposase-like protein